MPHGPNINPLFGFKMEILCPYIQLHFISFCFYSRANAKLERHLFPYVFPCNSSQPTKMKNKYICLNISIFLTNSYQFPSLYFNAIKTNKPILNCQFEAKLQISMVTFP